MSRNSSGTYTLPTGNPVVSGEIIEAAWANSTLSDIASALTDSLSRSGQGGMTAPFRLVDGTQAAPAFAFANETGSGAYRAAAGDWYLTVLGAGIARLRPSGMDVTGAFGLSGNATVGGNATVAGTLGVTGNATLSGALGVAGNFAVNTNKLTVDAATGNTIIAGGLSAGNTTVNYLTVGGASGTEGGEMVLVKPVSGTVLTANMTIDVESSNLRFFAGTSGGFKLFRLDFTGGDGRILSAGNYNDYAPTKTGGGASGTWGINISGNAATANRASGGSFFTAQTGSEATLGCDVAGQNVCYMFNNASAWGLYSASGGSIISYQRSSQNVTLGGAVATNSTNFFLNAGFGSLGKAYGCRAWANFDGGAQYLRASGNVSSIGWLAGGDYSVNFSTAMPDANYSAVVSLKNRDRNYLHSATVDTVATGYVQVLTGQSNAPYGINYSYIGVAVFR